MTLTKKIKALFFSLGYFKRREVVFLNKENLQKKYDIILITICFNNSEIIKEQYINLKNNLLDNFLYIIADNSNEQKTSDELQIFAKEEKLTYIKLPPNYYSSIDPSKSHGVALNYTYKKIIKFNKNFDYIGFIDQDIFPIEKIDLIKKINKLPYYGLVQKRTGGLYLWAGFCFFKKEFLLHKKINFMPTKGLDTGGGNYKIYNKDILESIRINHYYINTNSKKIIKETYPGIQKECLEYIDGWIHLMNSSNWLRYEKIEKDFNFIK